MSRTLLVVFFVLTATLGSTAPAWGTDYYWYRDADGDEYGDPGQPVIGPFPPPGYVENGLDCDDTNPAVHPGVDEVCQNQIDDNCNTQVDEGCVAGAPGRNPAGAIALAPPAPNPSRGSIRLSFVLPHEAPATLVVVDLGGRPVRRLIQGVLPAGEHRQTWDGRDERGSLAASGVYFVRLAAAGRSITRRIVAIR